MIGQKLCSLNIFSVRLDAKKVILNKLDSFPYISQQNNYIPRHKNKIM